MLLYAGGKLADYTDYSKGWHLTELGEEIAPWLILAIVIVVIVFIICMKTDPDKHEDASNYMTTFIAFMLVFGFPLLLWILIS